MLQALALLVKLSIPIAETASIPLTVQNASIIPSSSITTLVKFALHKFFTAKLVAVPLFALRAQQATT